MKYKILLISIFILILSRLVYSQVDFIQYPQPFNPTIQDTLKNLKVVFIFGGDEWHLMDDNVKIVCSAFKKYNINVRVVNSVKYIDKECKDADIIIYNGHGGLNHDTIPVGFYFSNNTNSYGGYSIKNNLSKIINPNALIIYMNACTGAGSSAADRLTTIKDIGFDEAKRRVYYNGSVYPENSAYYACNINGILSKFLYYFIEKKMTIQETYKSLECNCYDQKGSRLDTYKSYNTLNSNRIVQISRSDIGNNPKIKEGDYSHAFYADPNYKLASIFKSKPVKFIK